MLALSDGASRLAGPVMPGLTVQPGTRAGGAGLDSRIAQAADAVKAGMAGMAGMAPGGRSRPRTGALKIDSA